MSSKSRAIARLDAPLATDLSETKDDKAEGFVLAPGLDWLVALDLERAAANVFAISGVP